MYLSDLQSKDIVSIKDGSNLGKIIDAKIDDSGHLIEIIVQERRFWKKIGETGELRFTYNNIKKIGSDVILIDI